MTRLPDRLAILAAATIAAIPSPALAQAYQCRIPQQLSVPRVSPDGPTRRVPVTGYTLALSWAPEFCKGREGRRADAVQCSGRNGRFGLVVHGLWPDGRSTWPQRVSAWNRAGRGTTARSAPRSRR